MSDTFFVLGRSERSERLFVPKPGLAPLKAGRKSTDKPQVKVRTIAAWSALIALGIGTRTSRADSACVPPPRGDASIDEVAAWARTTGDLLGNEFLRAPEASDFETPFGTLIDSSCWKDKAPAARRARLDRLESILAFTITQTERCIQALPVGVLHDVIPTLRRMRIRCGERKGIVARADLWMGLSRSRNFTREYEVTHWSLLNDSQSVQEASGTLAHEALHFVKSSNRSWHDDVKSRDWFGCERSLFADQVYLLSAACFPGSNQGQLFYASAVHCPGVCESAFTEAEGQGLREFIDGYAEFNKAKAHSFREAHLFCERLREVARLAERVQKSRGTLSLRLERVKALLGRVLAAEPRRQALLSLLGRLEGIFRDAYSENPDLQGTRARLDRLREEVRGAIAQACASEALSQEEKGFCGLKSNPLESMADLLAREINDWNADDLALFYSRPRK